MSNTEDSAKRVEYRLKRPAQFEIDGHTFYYAASVNSKTCSVSQGQSDLVQFAWLHDIKKLTADGCTVVRIN